MAFTATEIAQVRRWLGFPLSPYSGDGITPSLDRVVSTGGEAEAVVRGYLTELASIWTQIGSLDSKLLANDVDEISIDAVRAGFALRSRGRMVVKQLAVGLELKARFDVFSAPKYDPHGHPFERWDR
jgi:hypothetical protein